MTPKNKTLGKKQESQIFENDFIDDESIEFEDDDGLLFHFYDTNLLIRQ